MGALTLGVPLHRDRASSAEPRLDDATLVARPSAGPRPPLRAAWAAALLLASSLAAAPAWAEAEAEDRLRSHFGDEFGVRLDVRGVELANLSKDLGRGRGTLEVARVRVRIGERGLIIELDGLTGEVRRETTRRPEPPRVTPDSTSASESADPVRRSGREQLAEAIAGMVERLHGVPLEIRSQGEIRITLSDELAVLARDPSLAIDAKGKLAAAGRIVAGTATREWLHGDLELRSEASDPLALELGGAVVLDPGAVARSLALHGTASPDHLDVALDEPSGGRATLVARRESDRVELDLDADELPVALLDPLVELLEQREPSDRAPAIGEARLTGHVELERRAGVVRARFDQVELTQLVVEREALAARPVAFGPLAIDGELTLDRDHAGAGQLVLGHAGVQIQVDAQLDADRLDLGLELPETDCQAVLDAMPEGTAPVLAGSRISGRLAASLGLHLDFAALAQARESYLGPDADPHAFDRAFEQGSFTPPGSLAFEFPFLERCRVDRLGPAVDLAGLSGAYRHEFVTGSGERRRRVLAAGDPGYVPIGQIPQLELAFVILEDWRFWDHDGFDREQMVKAFWYDLMAGRAQRGASTISQQTARSLWLGLDHGAGRRPGFDRSIARKLVEALLTAELERGVDKRRILEIYLNVIELGPEVRGVSEAARYHFGKRPQDLDLVEALHLASLAPAPVGYSRRFASGEIDDAWREHLRLQIRRMRVRGMISEEVAQRYLYPRLDLVPHPEMIAARP